MKQTLALIGILSLFMMGVPQIAPAGPVCLTLVVIGWGVLGRLELIAAALRSPEEKEADAKFKSAAARLASHG
jgi:hypothetical protein